MTIADVKIELEKLPANAMAQMRVSDQGIRTIVLSGPMRGEFVRGIPPKCRHNGETDYHPQNPIDCVAGGGRR